jgi:hypothetical protein
MAVYFANSCNFSDIGNNFFFLIVRQIMH